ncbi:MAG: ribosome recycling factor [Anaerolineae bacterium]
MIKDVLAETEDRMKKSVEALQLDLMGIRTGRASPALVERLKVDYYGTPTNLIELASISAPEPQLLTIRPWDASAIKDIERAILQSDLGLTPSNDGKLIRLSIPPLTEERRRDLTRVVAKRVEEARVAIRNCRRDGLNDLRELEKEKLISEDDFYVGKDELQELTDKYIGIVDEIGKAKEQEIMEI